MSPMKRNRKEDETYPIGSGLKFRLEVFTGTVFRSVVRHNESAALFLIDKRGKRHKIMRGYEKFYIPCDQDGKTS